MRGGKVRKWGKKGKGVSHRQVGRIRKMGWAMHVLLGEAWGSLG